MGATADVVRRSKKDGTLAYALQGDGTWKPFIGPELSAPILEVLGSDRESIALHLQELRDKINLRDTHNAQILNCVWRSNTCLRVCLVLTPENYCWGRVELADRLMTFNDNEFFDVNWMAKSIILHAMAETVRNDIERESVRDLAALVEEEEE